MIYIAHDWRTCFVKGFTHKRCDEIQKERKVELELYCLFFFIVECNSNVFDIEEVSSG